MPSPKALVCFFLSLGLALYGKIEKIYIGKSRILEIVELLNIVGMHFTQPATWCSIRLWRSQDTLLLALIILKHSKSLINGFAAMMPALIISLNFDGREASVAPAVETLRRNHL